MLKWLLIPWFLPTRPLTGRKLRFAQSAAVTVTVASLLMFLISLPVRYTKLWRLAISSYSVLHNNTSLQPWLIDEIVLAFPKIALGIEIGVMLLYFLNAVFLFRLRSHDWMALLTAAGLTAFALHITPTLHSWMQLGEANTLIGSVFKIVGLGCAFLFLYLFPGGFYSPAWMRLFFVGWLVWAVLWLLFPHSIFGFLDPYTMAIPNFIVFMSWWGVGIFSQIYRYAKVSGPLERQQTKYITFGATLLVIGYSVMVPVREAMLKSANPLAASLLFQMIAPYLYLLIVGTIPILITLSILRYRLWDIDIIIRRTLVYTGLTAFLGLLYYGVIILMQTLVAFVEGQQTALVTAVSTLLIASLFTPLRKRLQAEVDRNFYRQRYDAEQALAEFAAAARSETNLEILTEKLSCIVSDTLQPEAVTLWLARASSPPTDLDNSQSRFDSELQRI
jgi:hypothetical protein